MTLADLVERAKRRLTAGEAQPQTWADNEIELAACVNDALHELSGEVLMDTELRPWLQQHYNITLDATGVSTNLLSAAGSITGQSGEIILAGIQHGSLIDTDNNILSFIPHYSDFLRPQATAYAYYTLRAQKIHTRALGVAVNGPADIQSVNGPLTLTASFSPKNVTDVPLQLEDDLVNHLVKVVLRMTPSMN